MSARLGFGVLGAVIAVAMTLASVSVAVPVGDDDLPKPSAPKAGRHIDYGLELYKLKGRCNSCHGWAGDGMGAPHSAGNGANLRKTKLSRKEITEVISCGRPGTAMPHFNAFAYSEDHCYGATEADLGDAIPPDAPRSLQRREIEAIVDYLNARVIGRGEPNKADCIEFYGNRPVCDPYPDAPKR